MSTVTCPHCKGTGHPYDSQDDVIQEHLFCEPCDGTGVLVCDDDEDDEEDDDGWDDES